MYSEISLLPTRVWGSFIYTSHNDVFLANLSDQTEPSNLYLMPSMVLLFLVCSVGGFSASLHAEPLSEIHYPSRSSV
jgi:hypothetical protein